MILVQRRRHLAVFSALAVVLPTLFVSALLSRDPLPVEDAIPTALDLRESPPAVEGLAWTRTGALWDALGIEVAAVPGDGRVERVGLRPTRDPQLPKALVYWAPGTEPRGALPEDAVLVGSLAGGRPVLLALPGEAAAVAGRLVVYSLGHQRVMAESEAPRIRAGGERGRK
jgi:hypothetical protein